MDNKFEIGGRHFSLTKLDAIRQFHITRRVGPILVQALSNQSPTKAVSDDKEDPKKMMQLMLPFLDGLSKLSDADSEYVLYGLLSCVEVQQSSGNWAKVYANGLMMINDIELPILLQIAGHAFMFNMSSLFTVLPR